MSVAENNVSEALREGAVIPAASRAERFTSYDVAAFEVPGGREENWRFTPMKRLRGLHDGTAAASGEITLETDAAPELKIETVGRDDVRLGEAGVPSDRIAAQAYSSFTQATVVTVPKETKASKASTLRVHGPGEGKVAYGHLQVRAEAFAEAVIVLDHVGSGTYADNVEFVIGDSAKITVVSVQDWADDAVHVSEQHLRLGRDATLKHTVVTLGGDLVRVSPTATFADKGGDVEMLGLYFADAGQHQEHRLFVDHAVAHCKSNVMYKGALQGNDAHTVWIGDVLIRAAAEATDTYELNRNLVLTPGARADSVPNLEIETGEIEGAGHASATGRFDDEQLFYLQSRGIGEEAARRLVVRGFFHEILVRIGVPEVRERLEAAIEAELEAVGA
ncbi:iron-regulated ABC transporter permease protein SufD [Amycolatopsis sulphurea]|uniref:Iron-regulated ABC transporter permease protein SufD n=1 Tax=Amycolatopsis sulphurea TaxID=76022 RepID=A0A2A9G217_9PSEU|nr:Fe-S cluster assembly protein SufD [Amycolatopsis sulphurea]PFG56699.1 iron-regulated ABC transporter permease protein SufD [Amycolatopsis sulphurea]